MGPLIEIVPGAKWRGGFRCHNRILSWLWLLGTLVWGQPHHRLIIEPLDFTAGEKTEYPERIEQIASLGDEIFIRSLKDAYITVIDASGRILRNIGRSGEGPGELGTGVWAMGLAPDRLLVVPNHRRTRLMIFENETYSGYLPIKETNISFFKRYHTTNAFAISDDWLVFPAHPKTGHLAMAYRPDGDTRPVGDLVFGKKNGDLLRSNPGLNDTLWEYHDPFWYAVFRFEPLVLKFDASFRLTASFHLGDHPIMALHKKKLANYDASRIASPPTLIRDIQYAGGSLFLLAPETLFRIDPEKGAVLTSYSFHGQGEDFQHISQPLAPLNFWTFTVMAEGRIVLGPGFLWNHDLWTSTLPDVAAIAAGLDR